MRPLRSLCLAVLAAWAFLPAARAEGTACPPPPAVPTAAEMPALLRAARDHGLLWRITRDGHSSYLFGTLHVGQLGWAFPGPALRDALAHTDTLAVEMDISDPAVVESMRKLLAAAPRYPLPKPLADRLAQAVARSCLPAEAYRDQPPVMQAVTLSLEAGLRDGLSPAYGQDLMLIGFAKARREPVVGLESAATQVHALLPANAAESRDTVRDALDELEGDRGRRPLLRLAEAWARGDADDLAGYPQWCDCADDASSKAMLHRMLDERNPHMAEAVAKLHAQGKRLLVAVGSLHLVGDQGLPALLRRQGFQVERIAFDAAPASAPASATEPETAASSP